MRSVLLWSWWLLACSGPDEDDLRVRATADTGETGSSQEVAGVVSALRFVTVEDGVTEGFDLDDHVSTGDDDGGCGKEDMVDPNGVPGIDNAFASLVPVLRATEASALEDLLRQPEDAVRRLAPVEERRSERGLRGERGQPFE